MFRRSHHQQKNTKPGTVSRIKRLGEVVVSAALARGVLPAKVSRPGKGLPAKGLPARVSRQFPVRGLPRNAFEAKRPVSTHNGRKLT